MQVHHWFLMMAISGLTFGDGISAKSVHALENQILSSHNTEQIMEKSDANGWRTLDGTPPLLFGHQGEKILFPAHTLAAYEAAAILGADFVEPDLALTADGVLVCYHDVTLKGGTDIESHPELDYLKKNYSGIIGIVWEDIVDDWFIRDLTWDQIQTLRVTQNQVGVRLQYNPDLGIPRFTDFLDTFHRLSFRMNKTIGIIPELKHPSFHNVNWTTERFMETVFLQTLQDYGYAVKEGNPENCEARFESLSSVGKEVTIMEKIQCPQVIIQNFDKSVLEFVREKADFDLMMVVHPELELLTPWGLDEIAKIAQYYCVWKEYMVVGVEKELEFTGKEYDAELIGSLGGFIEATKFPQEAHSRGMKMALFTIPDSRENSKFGCAIECQPNNKTAEMTYFFDIGVDGFFAENVAESREIRLLYQVQNNL